MKERIAIAVTLSLLVLVPLLAFWYEYGYRRSRYEADMPVIELTGVGSSGTWTLEPVTNLNYWWKRFTPAILYLEMDRKVLLRLRSADVYHQFYVPALNIGPVPVRPGTIQELELQPKTAGQFEYFCTYMCGECHFYMRGWIVVTPPGETPVEADPLSCPLCLPDYGDPPEDDPIELGSYLYLSKGCVTCHGIEGEGGVGNYNYLNGEIPAHNTTVEKFFLRSREDAETLLDVIRRGDPVDTDLEEPDIAGFDVVKARFLAAEDLILQGKNAAPLDVEGPQPPLQMPTWKYKLDDREIDAILGYFISLYDWEDEI